MKEFVDKLISRLGEYHCENEFEINSGFIEVCIDIVNQLAEEYCKDNNVPTNNGWIPMAEMLFPRYGQKVFASVKCEDCKHEIIITKYERQEYWHNGIITAWQPLPEPFKERD